MRQKNNLNDCSIRLQHNKTEKSEEGMNTSECTVIQYFN